MLSVPDIRKPETFNTSPKPPQAFSGSRVRYGLRVEDYGSGLRVPSSGARVYSDDSSFQIWESSKIGDPNIAP